MNSRDPNKTGKLVIPVDANILSAPDRTLGIEYQVKKTDGNIFIYAFPPTKRIDDAVKKGNNLRQKKIDQNDFPAIIEDENGNPLIHVQQKLKPSQTVIALDITECPDKDILQVVEFKSVGEKHDDLPESGYAIQIQTIGYIRKDTLEKSKKIESFAPIDCVLFPNNNLINDIRQSQVFGDCFFLASIIGILNNKKGEEFIKNMMVQSPDGKQTTVRLYDPKTLTPVYIAVDNTYYTINGKNTVQHRAPWVHILEKAYTALAYKKNNDAKDEFYQTIPNFRELFGNGGVSATAMTILLGTRANYEFIPKVIPPWDMESFKYSSIVYFKIMSLIENPSFKPELQHLNDCLADMRQNFIGKLGNNPEEEAIKKALKTSHFAEIIRILSTSEKTADEIINELINSDATNKQFNLVLTAIANQNDDNTKMELLGALKDYLSLYTQLYISDPIQISQSIKNLSDVGKIGQYMVSLQADEEAQAQFEELISKPNHSFQDLLNFIADMENLQLKPRDSVIRPLRNYAQNAIADQQLNGEAGTGLYSEQALAVFNDIKSKLQESKLDENSIITLAASTGFKFEGEKIPGLAGNHSYAIIDVEEELREGQKPLLFVVVKNPWGRFGTKFDFQKKDANPYHPNQEHYITANEDPVSRIELTKFLSSFEIISYDKLPLPTLENIAQPFNPPSDESILTTEGTEGEYESLGSDSDYDSDRDNDLSMLDHHQSNIPVPQLKNEPGFLKKHWGKILTGSLVIASLVVASVFTAGMLPVVAGAIATTVGVSTKIATLIGIGSLAATGLIAGATATGVAAAKLESNGGGSSFVKRHWGKMLIGSLVVGSLAVAGIFTAGVVPAIAAAVAGGLALCGITIGTTAATIAAVSTVAASATAIGMVAAASISAVREHQQIKESKLQAAANPDQDQVKIAAKVKPIEIKVAPKLEKQVLDLEQKNKIIQPSNSPNASVTDFGVFAKNNKGKEPLRDEPHTKSHYENDAIKSRHKAV